MALFDSLITEVAEKFGLGGKATSLVSTLISMISSEPGGGLSGFLDRFKRVGLGDTVASWVGGGESMPLTSTQLQGALGSDWLNTLSAKVGLPLTSVTPALTFLIPTVVNKLTPNGVIPSSLPSLSSLVSGFAGMGKGMEASAGRAISSAAQTARPQGTRWFSLLSLLALALIAVLGYLYFSRAPEQAPQTATTAPTALPPSINSQLSLSNVNGKIKFSSVVPDAKARQEILDQLKATFGEGNFIGNITVDPNAKPANWLVNLGRALAAFKTPGAELNFDGDAISVGGEGVKTGLLDQLRFIFGDKFSFKSLTLDAEAAVKDAAAKASAALAALKPDSSAEELVGALNLQIINFASGRADIQPEHQELLKESAAAIKAGPQGVKLEVGGHTDSQGNAAGNQRLSQARAEAVRAFLIQMGVKPEALTAKGYGDVKPIASNDTEAGRFKNRRIEFSVVK